MAAEGSVTAALNGTKGFELLEAKARSIPIQETFAVRAQNVGYLASMIVIQRFTAAELSACTYFDSS
jgi:hypothetical protein